MACPSRVFVFEWSVCTVSETLTLELPERTIDASPAAEHLRANCAAVKLAVRWWGITRVLTPDQKEELVRGTEVDAKLLRATKSIIDKGHPVMRRLGRLRNQAVGTWRHLSLPYVEGGIRLMPRHLIPEFSRLLNSFRDELARGVGELAQVYPALLGSARQRLGRYFVESDYPGSVEGLFDLSWEFPQVEPPSFLLAIDSGLYAREARRVAERFDEAVQLAEGAFLEEFGRLVGHLAERLSDEATGQKKTFRDSSLENIRAFFDRFRTLNLRGNDQLENLVRSAQALVAGVEPGDLRGSAGLRQRMSRDLTRVAAEAEGLMVNRPRRRILRARMEVA